MFIQREAAVVVIAILEPFLPERNLCHEIRTQAGYSGWAPWQSIECHQCKCPIFLGPTGPCCSYHHDRWWAEVNDRTIWQSHGTQEIKSPGLCNIHQWAVWHHVVRTVCAGQWTKLFGGDNPAGMYHHRVAGNCQGVCYT